MSRETGDMWRQIKEEKRLRNEARLAKADPTGWKQHTEYHWSRQVRGLQLNYWPSTGKWQYNGRVRKDLAKMHELIAGAQDMAPVEEVRTYGATKPLEPGQAVVLRDDKDDDNPW